MTESGKTEIKKATLRMYCTYSSTDPKETCERDIKLYATETDWRENSFSWSNQPTIVGKIADVDTSAYRDNTWVEIDVTEYVKAHRGEVISVAILNEGAETEKNNLEFYSREQAGMEPQLVII